MIPMFCTFLASAKSGGQCPRFVEPYENFSLVYIGLVEIEFKINLVRFSLWSIEIDQNSGLFFQTSKYDFVGKCLFGAFVKL